MNDPVCQNCGRRLGPSEEHYDYRDNRFSCSPIEARGNGDAVHAIGKIEHAGKTFYLDHKSNARGHYVKLAESVQGSRTTLLLPIETCVAVARFLAHAAKRAGIDITV